MATQVESRGAFQAGTTAIFFVTFADLNGEVFDPSNIDVTINDPTGNTAVSITAADQLDSGVYAIEWIVPTAAILGLYTLIVDFTKEVTSGPQLGNHTENFIITESDIDVIDPEIIGFRNFVETLIGYSQRIPVFDEIARLNRIKTVAEVSFPRWNQPAGYKLFINGDRETTGHTVDYLKGTINFDVALASIDEVTISYNFRWFTDYEIDTFVIQALQVFNLHTPHSVHFLNNLPDRYGVTVGHQAAVFALRRLIMDLHFQEPAKVFGGMERADRLMGSLDTLKKNFEEDLNNWYEQKKYGPYLGLTKTITVPEFTLPGGRCIGEKSLVMYRIEPNIDVWKNDRIYKSSNNIHNDMYLVNSDIDTCIYTLPQLKIYQTTIKEMYELFMAGNNIEVLSDNSGTLSFEPVSHIWNSGIKPLIRIEDKYDNYVEVSDEHIMFINDEEVPASEVKVGDILTINLFDGVRNSRVTQISQVKETPTFDIEVPSTENLFVNNIKCHNSRWFRYLFKGA